MGKAVQFDADTPGGSRMRTTQAMHRLHFRVWRMTVLIEWAWWQPWKRYGGHSNG